MNSLNKVNNFLLEKIFWFVSKKLPRFNTIYQRMNQVGSVWRKQAKQSFPLVCSFIQDQIRLLGFIFLQKNFFSKEKEMTGKKAITRWRGTWWCHVPGRILKNWFPYGINRKKVKKMTLDFDQIEIQQIFQRVFSIYL